MLLGIRLVVNPERRACCKALAAPLAGLTDIELLQAMNETSAAFADEGVWGTNYDFRIILEAKETGKILPPDAVDPRVLKNFERTNRLLGALSETMLRIRGQGYDNHPDLACLEGMEIEEDIFDTAMLGVSRYLPNMPSKNVMRSILCCALAVLSRRIEPLPRGVVVEKKTQEHMPCGPAV
ncbi:MAG: hypothetical protein PHY92_04450 [Alphaproteobacteria bacterium]|nr:hypothetical protein [Alphaproteobacteria bacterium]